jgi:hypothetical protein
LRYWAEGTLQNAIIILSLINLKINFAKTVTVRDSTGHRQNVLREVIIAVYSYE